MNVPVWLLAGLVVLNLANIFLFIAAFLGGSKEEELAKEIEDRIDTLTLQCATLTDLAHRQECGHMELACKVETLEAAKACRANKKDRRKNLLAFGAKA